MAGPLLCLQGVSKQFLGIQVERAVCLACMGKRGKGKATAILASALNSVRLPLMPHPFWAIIASADFLPRRVHNIGCAMTGVQHLSCFSTVKQGAQ
eukprot:scaffold11923_cov18-Tisochrysis_lutea.AAC.2